MSQDGRQKIMVDKIVKYESGEMSVEEVVDFFQELINSGLCWQLQGHYGRTARHLIEEGLCNEPE
tara:strand:- start:293 stop:487 length:195 start_codon:yes stop_codon:yes gene_type:complete